MQEESIPLLPAWRTAEWGAGKRRVSPSLSLWPPQGCKPAAPALPACWQQQVLGEEGRSWCPTLPGWQVSPGFSSLQSPPFSSFPLPTVYLPACCAPVSPPLGLSRLVILWAKGNPCALLPSTVQGTPLPGHPSVRTPLPANPDLPFPGILSLDPSSPPPGSPLPSKTNRWHILLLLSAWPPPVSPRVQLVTTGFPLARNGQSCSACWEERKPGRGGGNNPDV